MRHTRIQQAKPERSFAERIVAVIVAIAMLGGMGYATTSAAMANDAEQTTAEQTTEQQAGISLGLHDYDRNAINKGHALKFKNAGPEEYNKYVGNDNGAYTGIVNKTLTKGYPTMADDKGSESLDYLFGGKSDSAVTSYEPTGGLLTLDKDGYYGFDADFQKATYDTVSNEFMRIDRTCTNQFDTPCFAPFGGDSENNKYSFGMNLGAEFYMPEYGKVNNQDMVFDFTGDDDVWVFIDGVLVLDLGGIHQALDGSIDFATGKITYDKPQSNVNSPAPAATIAEAFSKVGEKWDSTAYKTHHLSFFYLERGDGGSNCKIRFNLPVKPSKAIDIEKETLGTIDENKKFQFQLFVDSSPTPHQGKYSVYNAYTNQVVDPDVPIENNGVIKLARGQFARVQDNSFTDDTRYTVRELNSSDYTVSANGSPMTQQGSGDNAYAETGPFTVGTTSHVTIVNSNVKPSNNKSIVKTEGGDGDQYTLYLTASGDSTSSTVTAVTPADIVLVMDKSHSMNEDNRDDNAQRAANITSSAKIKVFSITDTLSQWVDPVDFVGTGDVTDSVTVRNGDTIEPMSRYAATYDSDTRTVTVTFNDPNGIVAEKTDVIDVSFKVKPSDAAYADYAKNNKYPDTGDTNTGDASAEQQGYHSNVDAKLKYCVFTKVNNVESCAPTEAKYPHPVVQVKLGKINITKQWSDGADKHASDSVTVQLQRKAIGAADSAAENVGSITLNADNKWAATVNNLLPGYTYSVVETPGNDRYDVTYTGNDADLTKEMVWSSNADEGTLNATITNTLKPVSLQHLISVQKNLTGREWKNSDQFSFILAAENNAPLPASCKDQQPCTVTVKHDSTEHSAAFGDITYNAGDATYTYYVTENSGSISALHYSQAKYKVVVTVAKNAGAWTASVTSVTKVQDDNGKEVPESQSASTQPVAFTNHYIAVSALPLTGGTTDRQWLFVGGAVGGLAVLLIGAAGVWNGKKRLV